MRISVGKRSEFNTLTYFVNHKNPASPNSLAETSSVQL